MSLRVCATCKESKPTTEFSVNRARKDGLMRDCRECNREKCKRYYEANREHEQERRATDQKRWRREHPDESRQRNAKRRPRNREMARVRHARYRDLVFGHYGQSCSCCGNTERLSIDHITGNGKAHRAEIGAQSAVAMYRWLVVNGFPAGFQTLCSRCNRSKGTGERCMLAHVRLT